MKEFGARVGIGAFTWSSLVGAANDISSSNLDAQETV